MRSAADGYRAEVFGHDPQRALPGCRSLLGECALQEHRQRRRIFELRLLSLRQRRSPMQRKDVGVALLEALGFRILRVTHQESWQVDAVYEIARHQFAGTFFGGQAHRVLDGAEDHRDMEGGQAAGKRRIAIAQ